MSKIFRVRKPRLRVTSKGVRLTKPSARIGGQEGINVSSRGLSGSLRTPAGTYNTRRGCSFRLLGLLILTIFVFFKLHP